jgi:hypothetical protein
MTEDIAHRLDRLDDREAIHLVELLLQAARDGTPELAAMDEAAIASRLKTIAIEPEIFARAAAFLEEAPTEPLPSADAAVAARELLVIFARHRVAKRSSVQPWQEGTRAKLPASSPSQPFLPFCGSLLQAISS